MAKLTKIKPKKRVVLAFSKGNLSGQAMYLSCINEAGGGSGTRVAGDKCYGIVRDIAPFSLKVSDIDTFIQQLQKAKEFLEDKDE